MSFAIAKAAPQSKAPAKEASDQTSDKGDKQANKAPIVEAPIENVVNVTTNELVDKPHEYLNKNVKFTAKFFAFSSLALDYKPAMRSSKTHLSFLVLRPESHVPYSELKLAMAIPKEKDPENQILTTLKDGDQVELIGKVFATPLDEPWVDVLRLKKLASADEKKEDKKLSSKDNDSVEKLTHSKTELSKPGAQADKNPTFAPSKEELTPLINTSPPKIQIIQPPK
jgi:hypothetical protein